MQLEDYFDFLAPNDIRLKGSRIGIESVLYEYIHRGKTPEEPSTNDFRRSRSNRSTRRSCTICTIKKKCISTMTEWIEFGRRMREEQEKNPPPVIQKLRQLRTEPQITATGFDASAFRDQIVYLPVGGF